MEHEGLRLNQGGVVRGTATISFNAGYGMQTVDVPITATVKIAKYKGNLGSGRNGIWTVPCTKPMLPEYLEVRYDNHVSSESPSAKRSHGTVSPKTLMQGRFV